MKSFMTLPAVLMEELEVAEMLLVCGGVTNVSTNNDSGRCSGANNGDGRCDGNNNYGGVCSGTNNDTGKCGAANTFCSGLLLPPTHPIYPLLPIT